MIILVDANVWLRSVQPNHPQQRVAKEAMASLWAGNHEPAVVPQVLYEFWVVATRPEAQNGLGLSPARADDEIGAIVQTCPLLHDDRGVFDHWRNLVTSHNVSGKPAHDARLAAAMLRHGVTHLLTFNAADFARYGEITALAPESAATFPPAAPSA